MCEENSKVLLFFSFLSLPLHVIFKLHAKIPRGWRRARFVINEIKIKHSALPAEQAWLSRIVWSSAPSEWYLQ